VSVAHPIPYQGSKRRLARVILRCFPDDVGRLVEPFAGSAAVTLAAAYHGRAGRFLLNDTNHALIDLWGEILNHPERLSDAYTKLWHAQEGQERVFYDLVRDRFNQLHRPADFLYLLARCVKASVRYNAAGEFNQSPDNRRRGKHPARMRRDIHGASQLLSGRVSLRADDYRSVLAEASPHDVVYMDPPYQGVCGNRDPRYIDAVSLESFSNALAQANEAELSYIVSYDGRTGSKGFGRPLPEHLNLVHIELEAGPSSQATLLGRKANTVESLYLSPALVNRLGGSFQHPGSDRQLSLLELR